VAWAKDGGNSTYQVELKIIARDRRHLLADVSNAIAEEKVSILVWQDDGDERCDRDPDHDHRRCRARVSLTGCWGGSRRSATSLKSTAVTEEKLPMQPYEHPI
jgi:hypothetical protein